MKIVSVNFKERPQPRRATIVVTGKLPAGPGPHDYRTRQPGKKFHPEEPGLCAEGKLAGFSGPKIRNST